MGGVQLLTLGTHAQWLVPVFQGVVIVDKRELGRTREVSEDSCPQPVPRHLCGVSPGSNPSFKARYTLDKHSALSADSSKII